jgi:radical SAM protein with 4Fe4S-binding SPASM domain
MANLSITSLCNRRCSYCFARDRGWPYLPDGLHMTDDVFLSALDFLQRSGMTQVRLLGGEPTLHPRIREFLEEIKRRGLSALIFSNGLMPESVLDYLEKSEKGRIALLINVSLAENPGEERERQRMVLRRLRSKVMLGVNMTSPAVDLSILLEWTLEFQLSPFIRLGLAHPCLGSENESLHPSQYAAVGDRLQNFRKKARQQGISLRYDCGFVPCLFRQTEPDALKEIMAEAQFVCSPIPDILPDGSLIPCYPLGRGFREARIPAEEGAAEVRDRFSRQWQSFRGPGIYRECDNCPFRQAGVCAGGCLAAALKRLRHKKNTPLPIAYEK